MKIGIVVPGFSAGPDDWCIPALRHLVARLAQTDDVRVIALRYPYRPHRYEAFGAMVTALGGGARQRAGSAAVWYTTLAVLRAEHRRRPFDVLHAFWANETGALTAFAGRWLDVPTVVSLAGGELVGIREIGYGGQLARSERLKVRLALGMAGWVTAGSHYLLDLAAPWLHRRSLRTYRRIPLGVDLELFHPDGSVPANDAPRLVHAASLSPVKDQATLLQALGRLPQRAQPERLEIAGAGPLEGVLRSLADQLGLSGAIRWRGEIPHNRLRDFYRQGAVAVFSSRHEAQCLAILEAAACGLPVVGTRVGVLPELTPEAAIGVPTGDPAALAETVAELLDDPARRLALGKAGRARIEAEFSVECSATEFRVLYERAVEEPSR